MKPLVKLITLKVENKTRVMLALIVLSLLASAACGSNKPAQWDGQFTGKLEERMEESDSLAPSTVVKDFGIKENIVITAASEGENDKVVTFGDCQVRFRTMSDAPGSKFEPPDAPICKVNFGGYSGDFNMYGQVSVTKDKKSGNDRMFLTVIGRSTEKLPNTDKSKMTYTYSFSGERKQ